MGINNPGANSIDNGTQTQNANSMHHGIDVFTSGSPPASGFYVPENGTDFYVTEDGLSNYVTES